MAVLHFTSALGRLTVTDSKGTYVVRATSGAGKCSNNPKCEGMSNLGPIPRGQYIVCRKDLIILDCYTILLGIAFTETGGIGGLPFDLHQDPRRLLAGEVSISMVAVIPVLQVALTSAEEFREIPQRTES